MRELLITREAKSTATGSACHLGGCISCRCPIRNTVVAFLKRHGGCVPITPGPCIKPHRSCRVVRFRKYLRAFQPLPCNHFEDVVWRPTRPAFRSSTRPSTASNRQGNLDNTFPNPYLRKRAGSSAAASSVDSKVKEDGKGEGEGTEDEYLPAYMLSDWSLERAGRGERKMDTLACELR